MGPLFIANQDTIIDQEASEMVINPTLGVCESKSLWPVALNAWHRLQ